jgi:hypothetical protein
VHAVHCSLHLLQLDAPQRNHECGQHAGVELGDRRRWRPDSGGPSRPHHPAERASVPRHGNARHFPSVLCCWSEADHDVRDAQRSRRTTAPHTVCQPTHAALPCLVTVRRYKWDVQDALRLIEKERITIFNGVPSMSMELLKCPDLSKFNVSSVRAIGGGGAPTPPQMIPLANKRIPTAMPNQVSPHCAVRA